MQHALTLAAHTAMLIVATLALCASLAGCAGMAPGQRSGDDPLEPLNRAVFDVNTALDDSLIKPVAEAYRAVVPEFVRDRIRSVIDNLAEPRIFVNDVLQGRFNAAGFTFARFFANTIAGVGGLFDFATVNGLAKQTGDFGQTLSAWGVDDGPYVVLLFFGPSNVRDALGWGVDLATTPAALIVSGPTGRMINVVTGVFDGVDLRSRNIETFDAIRASALDPYSHLKSVTRQYRAAQLREARGLEAAPAELIDPESPLPR